MFEVKLFEIINAKEAITDVIKLPMSALLSRHFGKFFKFIEKEVEEFSRIRNKKVQEYGDKNVDNENLWIIKPDFISKFNEEITELLNVSVNVHLNKIVLDEKFPPISPDKMILLDWIFEEGEK